MDVYENKSKKLIEDYDKYFRKAGAPSILDQFDSHEPVEVEAIVKWRSGSSRGAKQLQRFEVAAYRPVGDGEFEGPARGSFLLSSKIQLDGSLTREHCPAVISGVFTRAKDALLIQRMSLLPAVDHPELAAKLADLTAPRSFQSDLFGEIKLDLTTNEWRGELSHGGRTVRISIRDASSDQIGAQTAKLASIFDNDDFKNECVQLLRKHRKFRQHVAKDVPVHLTALRLNGNLLFASFYAAGVNFANVVAGWDDDHFGTREVDEVDTQ